MPTGPKDGQRGSGEVDTASWGPTCCCVSGKQPRFPDSLLLDTWAPSPAGAQDIGCSRV